MGLKIVIVSDLHLEFSDKLNISEWPDADVIAFCGDIGVGLSAKDLILKAVASGKWKHVFYLMGNHEGYNQVWEKVELKWAELAKENGFHFLKDFNTAFEIGDYIISGATLWTDLSEPSNSALAQYYMNDYHKIYSIASFNQNEESRFMDKVLGVDVDDPKTWAVAPPSAKTQSVNGFMTKCRAVSPHVTTAWHKLAVWNLEQLAQHAAEVEKKLIVFTHHTPHKECLSPKHSGKNGALNPAYFTDLEYLFPYIHLWGCGHTHNRLDTTISGCRIVMNGRGYVHSSYVGGTEIPGVFSPTVVEV